MHKFIARNYQKEQEQESETIMDTLLETGQLKIRIKQLPVVLFFSPGVFAHDSIRF